MAYKPTNEDRRLLTVLTEIEANASGDFITPKAFGQMEVGHATKIMTIIVKAGLASSTMPFYDEREYFILPEFGTLTDNGIQVLTELRKILPSEAKK